MKKIVACTFVLVTLTYGCSNPEQSSPNPPVTQNLPVEKAIDSIKEEVTKTTAAAKSKLADEAGAEIERIYNELLEVAGNFNENADALEGDAKAEFDKMREEFNQKKQAFNDKLAQFKSGTADDRDGMLKDLYDALSELKSTLDRATQSFQQTEVVEKPA